MGSLQNNNTQMVEYQNTEIENKIKTMDESAIYQIKKYEYQSQGYASINKIKIMATYVFYLLLAVYTIYLIGKHIAQTRNYSFVDFGMLLLFASFPFWILWIEQTIYSAFSYLVAIIKNTIYINNFYTVFNNTNFYDKPQI